MTKWYKDEVSVRGTFIKQFNYVHHYSMMIIREAAIRGNTDILDGYHLFQKEELMRDLFTEHMDVIHLDVVKWLANHGMHFHASDYLKLKKLNRNDVLRFISNHYKHPVGRSIVFSHEDLKAFVSVLQSLTKYTHDLVIRDRRILQVMAWNVCAIDIDLSSCLDYEDEILLDEIKLVAKLLRPLLNRKECVRLLFDQDEGRDVYTFSTIPEDSIPPTTVQFRKPSLFQMYVRTIGEQALPLYFPIKRTLASFLMPEEIIERIAAFKRARETRYMMVSFEDGKALFSAGYPSDYTMTFMTARGNEKFDDKYVRFNLTWFLLKSPWLQVNIYESDRQSHLLLKLDYEMNGIPYTLWSYEFIEPTPSDLTLPRDIVMNNFPGTTI